MQPLFVHGVFYLKERRRILTEVPIYPAGNAVQKVLKVLAGREILGVNFEQEFQECSAIQDSVRPNVKSTTVGALEDSEALRLGIKSDQPDNNVTDWRERLDVGPFRAIQP